MSIIQKMKLALSFLLFVSAHARVEDAVSDGDRPSLASLFVIVERLIIDNVSFPMECMRMVDQ